MRRSDRKILTTHVGALPAPEEIWGHKDVPEGELVAAVTDVIDFQRQAEAVMRRLRGKGLPGKTPGDQIVVLNVVMPPQVGPGARKLFEELAEEMRGFDPRDDRDKEAAS